MNDTPIGRRFSLVYLDRGTPARDSERFRRRLAEIFRGTGGRQESDLRYRFGTLIQRELGVEVAQGFNGYMIEDFFVRCETRDLLDSITLAFRALSNPPAPARATMWRLEVARALAEENMGYTLDEQCGVHYHVDQEFERNRASAIAALQAPGLANAAHSYDAAFRHLDARPPDTKAAVRAAFEAAEIVARLICPETNNLNRWLADNTLRQRCLATMSQDATEQAVAAKLFDGLADWIDGLHRYRHGQAEAEVVAPSEQLAVNLLSSGSTYVRMLAVAHQRIAAG
jgi:hypothetical protein